MPDYNPVHILDGILNVRYMEVYWFFIPLFGVYLSILVLASIKDKMKAFSYGSALGIIPYPVRSYFYLGNKKGRISAVCGVSQTPI